MASDITLAVEGGARRMTYAELADMRRISAASAERLVRRKGWVRTTGNDGVVRVLFPLAEARKPPKSRARTKGMAVSGQADSQGDKSVVRTLEAAVSALSVQLEHERNRADRAERRIDELQAALVEERRKADRAADRPAAPVVATVVPVTGAMNWASGTLLRG